MQKIINKYTQYLKPIKKVDEDILNKISPLLREFANHYKQGMPTNPFGYIEWRYSMDNPYRTMYDPLLKAYAELLGVKVMYRDQLDDFDREIHGYYFIGDEIRISILTYLWNWTFQILTDYRKIDWGREAYLKNKRIASIKVKELIINISLVVKELLVIDLKYDYYLEKYIQLHFKLDYKDYITDEQQYYHAISNYYHNRRMLL